MPAKGKEETLRVLVYTRTLFLFSYELNQKHWATLFERIDLETIAKH